MFRQCCVLNCASSREDAKLHKFPSDKERQMQWLDAIGFENLCASSSATYLEQSFVCYKHFEKRFITKKRRILSNAYPSLFTSQEILSGLPSRSFSSENKGKVKSMHSLLTIYFLAYVIN